MNVNVNLYRYPIPPNQPSACVSLSTIDILFQAQFPYTTWHILFDPVVEWIYVGEIKFLGPDFSYPGMRFYVIWNMT